ncbi:MAG TPA: hypothetical protein DEB74_18410 [Lachnospiraceae bacterium]|nr:hypothetical protein [Lachnospiraceae bacterium]
MIAICIESSHKRGMGHFFRALNLLDYLEKVNEKIVIVINKDRVSNQILDENHIMYETVDYSDVISNWENKIIQKYQIKIWILDKYETTIELTRHVKEKGVILAAIDDVGVGAELVDLHFCSMIFHSMRGKYIYTGIEYLILNQKIKKYRRQRTKIQRILVTLGGSDTYGVTVKMVKLLKQNGCHADIIIGPNFSHLDLLEQELNSHFVLYKTVPSLIAKFYEYDIAITGGGVTCFEANASGLPCIIVANEIHEIEIGKYLASFGGAIFAGYYKDVEKKDIDISEVDIVEMSKAALQAIPLNGMENIYKEIQNFKNNEYLEEKRNAK